LKHKIATDDPTNYALIFFILAVIILVLAIVCYSFMEKNKFYIYYKNYRKPVVAVNADSKDNVEDDQGLLANQKSPMSNESEPVGYFDVFHKLSLHFFCVMFTFFVTLANFPAITASVKPKNSGTLWTDKYFTPVTCFLLFNLGDFIGRWSIGKVSWPSKNSKLTLLTLVLARTVFFFLFAFCNAKPRHHSSPLFTNDIVYIAIMMMFSLSNGYLSTLAIKYAPDMVQTKEERELGGKMMAFAMSLGLAMGAGCSFLTVSLI